MILVDDRPVISNSSTPVSGNDLLVSLLNHPSLIKASDRFKSTPLFDFSGAPQPYNGSNNHVYVFQREFATVDPNRVQLVGTDEATTCVGLVIRNQKNGMTSVGHLDFPKIVDFGISQMLSLLGDCESDASLEVHLVGSFEDAPNKLFDDASWKERHEEARGYSWSLCSKVIEVLESREERFHLKTLCILWHNTKKDSVGNSLPIITGFVVCTSSGSILPANFDRDSRCPDEIVRRIRLAVCSDDPSWRGKLLETYDTHNDRFRIAPCSWMPDWSGLALSLQQLSDSEILQQCSTSPAAEGPDFVDNERRLWSYLIEFPDWRRTFPGRKARVFNRTAVGNWSRYQ